MVEHYRWDWLAGTCFTLYRDEGPHVFARSIASAYPKVTLSQADRKAICDELNRLANENTRLEGVIDRLETKGKKE